MMSSVTKGLSAALVLLLVTTTAHSYDKQVTQDDLPPMEKRPFCNAFTGCGRKRSDALLVSLAGSSEDRGYERVPSKLMAEARLWKLLKDRLTEPSDARNVLLSEMRPNSPVLDLIAPNVRRRRSAPVRLENVVKNFGRK